MAEQIEEFVEKRGIKSLFHFTRIENLDSILEGGLLSKLECNNAKINFKGNDPYRLDGTDAVCASISFPNYKMFWPLRCDNNETEWIVLKLKRSLLWETRCAFCVTNAASNAITVIPIEQRQGPSALEKMFDDQVNGRTRADLQIPDHYTTDPQAEVLLLDGAPASSIKGVYFQTGKSMKAFQEKYDSIPFHLNGGFFSGRSDSQHWK